MVNNFTIRSFSSLLLLTLLASLFLLKLSHFIFIIFFIIVYFELFNNKIINIFWIIVLFLGYLLFLNFDKFIYDLFVNQKILIFLIFFITTIISFVKKNILFNKVLLNIFIYLCFLLFTLLYVYNFNLFFIVILLTSINDIIAYVSGSYLKGPKIIPIISPNKTWSGTIFSYLISVFLITYFFNFHYL